MAGRFLRIAGFGLIGDAPKKGPYRQVIFRDDDSNESAEITVYKLERPSLWEDIEKLELGKQIPTYRGSIERYKLTNIVVLGNETPEQAYEKQKLGLTIKNQITYAEAEIIRNETMGYITDLTNTGAMEIAWRKIDKQAKKISFRQYAGRGNFEYTDWYDIIN